MKPIQLGIIGLGHRGHSLAQMLRQHAAHRYEIIGVCDEQPMRRHQTIAACELPASAEYSDHRALLENPDIEAVLLETGAQALAPLALEVLAAGKHVLADVPMIFTRDEAAQLAAVVEKTGLVYSMAEQVRFANFVVQWQRHLENGDIGEPLFVQGEYIHPAPGFYYDEVENSGAPASHSALIDPREQARDPRFRKAWRNSFKHPIKYIPHELSPLLKILDDRVTEVSCFSADARSYGDAVEMLDVECALMKTAKGRVIRIVNSFTVPLHAGKEEAHHWYHITGSEGFVENARPGWQGNDVSWEAQGQETIRRRDGSIERTHYGWERPDNVWADFSGGHGGLEAFVFEGFYNAIREGSPNESDIYATIEAVLPGIIAAESAEAGGVKMDVPNFRRS
jgi:predicted dehydrogenase